MSERRWSYENLADLLILNFNFVIFRSHKIESLISSLCNGAHCGPRSCRGSGRHLWGLQGALPINFFWSLPCSCQMIRPFFRYNAQCWFCSLECSVTYQQLNDFMCPHCDQVTEEKKLYLTVWWSPYNGMYKDDDHGRDEDDDHACCPQYNGWYDDDHHHHNHH